MKFARKESLTNKPMPPILEVPCDQKLQRPGGDNFPFGRMCLGDAGEVSAIQKAFRIRPFGLLLGFIGGEESLSIPTTTAIRT